MTRQHDIPAPDGSTIAIWDCIYPPQELEIPRLTGTPERFQVVDTGSLEIETRIARCEDATVLAFAYDKIPVELLDRATKLRAIVRYGVGYETFPLSAMTERGIQALIVPGYSPETIATNAIGHLYAVCRQLSWLHNEVVHHGRWTEPFNDVPMIDILPSKGRDKKVFGVIGLGSIGRETAQLAMANRLEVIAYDRYLPADRVNIPGVTMHAQMEDIFEQADFISLHCPLTPKTSHLINDDAIRRMKDGVVLINCARGGVMHEGDVVRGIESGKIACVAVDVLEEEKEWTKSPLAVFARASRANERRVLISPHVSPRTPNGKRDMRNAVCDAALTVLRGGFWHGIVNHVVLKDHPGHDDWFRDPPWSRYWELIESGEKPPLKRSASTAE